MAAEVTETYKNNIGIEVSEAYKSVSFSEIKAQQIDEDDAYFWDEEDDRIDDFMISKLPESKIMIGHKNRAAIEVCTFSIHS